MTIDEAYRRFKSVNLRQQIPILIEQDSETVIELNQSQLYDRSVDSNGEPLRLYSSQAYAIDKNRMNSKPGLGRPDLFVTGQFYKGFNIRVTRNALTIRSSDSKTSDLIKKYGEGIFGLDPVSKDKFRPILHGNIVRYIKSVTKV